MMFSAPPSDSIVERLSVLDPAASSSDQMRVITSWRCGASIRPSPPGSLVVPAPTLAKVKLPRAHLVNHLVDELGFDVDPCVRSDETVVRSNRLEDRRSRGVGSQVLQAQIVREELGNATLESIEARQRVFADGEQDVDAEGFVVHHCRQVVDEGIFVIRVVEEVLVELIEDQEQVRVCARVKRSSSSCSERLAAVVESSNPKELPMVRRSAAVASSRHVANIATRKPGESSLDALRIARRRRRGISAARSTELSPTPDAPYRMVSRAAKTLSERICAFSFAPEEERLVLFTEGNEPDERAVTRRTAKRWTPWCVGL